MLHLGSGRCLTLILSVFGRTQLHTQKGDIIKLVISEFCIFSLHFGYWNGSVAVRVHWLHRVVLLLFVWGGTRLSSMDASISPISKNYLVGKVVAEQRDSSEIPQASPNRNDGSQMNSQLMERKLCHRLKAGLGYPWTYQWVVADSLDFCTPEGMALYLHRRWSL